jgi:hypothetical protein
MTALATWSEFLAAPKNQNVAGFVSEIEAKPAVSGGCLCNEVRFTINRLTEAVLCHCSQCRKAQGTGFACNFPVAANEFSFTKGENKTQTYRSSENKVRVFCAQCGSPIYSQRDDDGTLRIRSGALDTTSDLSIVAHIFVRDLPSWSPITDDLPQHAQFEPSRG